MLIAMAGLPAAGKSTLAASLAKELQGVVLDKDQVRTALFPVPVLDYSPTQDDIAMAAIYEAAAAILRAHPQLVVILDGRTFLLPGQVQPYLDSCTSLGQAPRIIECVCADAVSRQRLEQDVADHRHPAGNRTYELYLLLKSRAVPVTVPHIIVDTCRQSLTDCIRQCMEQLQSAE